MGNGEQKALEMILEFARKQERVRAVHSGVFPEGAGRVYYFLVSSPWNPEFEERLSELDLRIARETDYRCDLLSWPVEEERQEFIKESIWEKK